MSARHLIVLALVAYVTFQADSLPYGTKGSQSYYTQSFVEPLKGSASYVATQQAAEPIYRQEPVASQSPAPVVAPTQSVVSAPAQAQAASYQYEVAPVRGHYQPEQRYEAPRVQQHYEAAPVQMVPYAQAEPLKAQYVPLARRVEASYRPVYQEVPASYSAPAPVQVQVQAAAFQAPAKGVEYYQQSSERVPLGAQYESAPVKGSYAQTYPEQLKGAYTAPQSATAVVSAPAQLQSSAVQVEAAPVKGQSFYQAEQRFETAPVRQTTAPKA